MFPVRFLVTCLVPYARYNHYVTIPWICIVYTYGLAFIGPSCIRDGVYWNLVVYRDILLGLGKEVVERVFSSFRFTHSVTGSVYNR